MFKRFVAWLYRKVVVQPVEFQTVEIHLLTTRQFQALRAKLPNTHITDGTSELNAAYKLGIQHALAAIQEGFVNERT